jgi:hypothetical protein
VCVEIDNYTIYMMMMDGCIQYMLFSEPGCWLLYYYIKSVFIEDAQFLIAPVSL